MSTDYYETLGVSRDASHSEIKSAFRRLARELHPDVSAEPEADRRFRAVAEAYEVLSDPERRRAYDRFGDAGVRGGFAPVDTEFGSLSDVFAAFFGETPSAPGLARLGSTPDGALPESALTVGSTTFFGVSGITLSTSERPAISRRAATSATTATPGTVYSVE